MINKHQHNNKRNDSYLPAVNKSMDHTIVKYILNTSREKNDDKYIDSKRKKKKEHNQIRPSFSLIVEIFQLFITSNC